MKCAKPRPIEFAITRWRENRRSAFIGHRVEIDGIEQDVPPMNRTEARRWCRRMLKRWPPPGSLLHAASSARQIHPIFGDDNIA